MKKIIKKQDTHEVGSIAGDIDEDGLLQVEVEGQMYYAHHLAWLYVYGELPQTDIYHINGVKTDNRIANLTQVSKS